MPIFPRNHPERLSLADEVHARPPEPVQTPARASYVAVLVDAEAREREAAHLARLCRESGAAPPPAGATHWRADIGGLRLKWERHGEFSGYLFIAPGTADRPFADPPTARLPAGWLAGIPGATVAAVHVDFLPGAAEPPPAAALAGHFAGHAVVGSRIADAAACDLHRFPRP